MLTTCRVIQLAGEGARIASQVQPWRWCAYFDSKLPLTWEAGQRERGDRECGALLGPSPASEAISPPRSRRLPPASAASACSALGVPLFLETAGFRAGVQMCAALGLV